MIHSLFLYANLGAFFEVLIFFILTDFLFYFSYISDEIPFQIAKNLRIKLKR